MSLMRFRPSPAMIIAALALTVTLAGTAVAAPELATRAITKSKVKKVARKQADRVLDQREAELSVASARTAERAIAADRATTADAATTATRAASADSADTATRAASANSADTATTANRAFSVASQAIQAWNGADQIVATLGLPAGSYALNAKVLANANGPTGATVECRLELGGAVLDPGGAVTLFGLDDPGDRAFLPLSGIGTLGASGEATVICAATSAVGNWLNRAITAVEVRAVG